MPGMEPAGRYAELRRQEASSPKVLYAVDALAAADSPVHDLRALTHAAMNAVNAGAGHVLESAHVVFPNGAITLVLVLAESHLSVHTWPEESLVAIDLFSCGAIDGDAVIADLVRALGLASARTRELPRGI